MTLTYRNKTEVLFEKLGQEDTAMITGGVTIAASASAQFSSPTQPTVQKELTVQKPITDIITKLPTSELGLTFPVNIQSDELTKALQIFR
ncbi:hypothetical protein [Iningainema tapete]|uniref:Uncharacterized protein n=1 Tax=Iningainema tapete BLCC-T55 TaxID=2748662 RepID=A0A8J6XK48_9CYAN|nr:hypothetical protein [Iningainema tapete]MBD2772311.1 hypothetical protein [Iningainema tapete BLCC-T55]